VYVAEIPVEKLAVLALVMAGASSLVRVNACVAVRRYSSP